MGLFDRLKKKNDQVPVTTNSQEPVVHQPVQSGVQSNAVPVLAQENMAAERSVVVEPLDASQGVSAVVSRMQRYGQGSLDFELNLEGSEMNYVLRDASSERDRGIAAPGDEWFKGVAALYTDEEKSSRGAFIRARISLGEGIDGDRPVTAVFTRADGETTEVRYLVSATSPGGMLADDADTPVMEPAAASENLVAKASDEPVSSETEMGVATNALADAASKPLTEEPDVFAEVNADITTDSVKEEISGTVAGSDASEDPADAAAVTSQDRFARIMRRLDKENTDPSPMPSFAAVAFANDETDEAEKTADDVVKRIEDGTELGGAGREQPEGAVEAATETYDATDSGLQTGSQGAPLDLEATSEEEVSSEASASAGEVKTADQVVEEAPLAEVEPAGEVLPVVHEELDAASDTEKSAFDAADTAGIDLDSIAFLAEGTDAEDAEGLNTEPDAADFYDGTAENAAEYLANDEEFSTPVGAEVDAAELLIDEQLDDDGEPIDEGTLTANNFLAQVEGETEFTVDDPENTELSAGNETKIGTALVPNEAQMDSSETEPLATVEETVSDEEADAFEETTEAFAPVTATSHVAAEAEEVAVPAVIDEKEWEQDSFVATGTVGSTGRGDASAPNAGAYFDVAPSYSLDAENNVVLPSKTQLAPGNLVLTEAEVVERFKQAQLVLFGEGGSARDVSTVLIRIRSLGSYYDALTHVRRDGFWDQQKTFELVPEEVLDILQLKSDSYKEGFGAPLAMMLRFTPGVPVEASFDYSNEEAFVQYPDHLPAQQYVEELRMFPRTGTNIPVHMSEALASWTL